jgi:hypothetical protein
MTASCGSDASCTASSTIEPKPVAATSNAPLRPGHVGRDRAGPLRLQPDERRQLRDPLSSVSSVNGVGANAPPPIDRRAVHAADGLNSAETRGLTSVPLAVHVDPRAGRDRDPRSQRDVVLREHGGHREDVNEARQIPRGEAILLQRAPTTSVCRPPASSWCLAERRVPGAALHDIAEGATLAVARPGGARREHPPAGDPSPDRTGVGAERVQILGEGRAVGRQRAGLGAAVALLDDGSAGHEQRRAGVRLDRSDVRPQRPRGRLPGHGRHP